jgi:hypothetical protein
MARRLGSAMTAKADSIRRIYCDTHIRVKIYSTGQRAGLVRLRKAGAARAVSPLSWRTVGRYALDAGYASPWMSLAQATARACASIHRPAFARQRPLVKWIFLSRIVASLATKLRDRCCEHEGMTRPGDHPVPARREHCSTVSLIGLADAIAHSTYLSARPVAVRMDEPPKILWWRSPTAYVTDRCSISNSFI